MRLIGVMCTSGNGFSRDILIDRARFIVFLNVIYYTIALNDPFIIVHFSFTLTVVLMWLGEIPVPIPNTEVKSLPVDDTWAVSSGKVD